MINDFHTQLAKFTIFDLSQKLIEVMNIYSIYIYIYNLLLDILLIA